MSTTNKKEWQKEHFKTSKPPWNHSLLTNKHTSHVTKAAGIEVFSLSEKNESALAGTNRIVKDRPRKSGSIQERSLTRLAPGDIPAGDYSPRENLQTGTNLYSWP